MYHSIFVSTPFYWCKSHSCTIQFLSQPHSTDASLILVPFNFCLNPILLMQVSFLYHSIFVSTPFYWCKSHSCTIQSLSQSHSTDASLILIFVSVPFCWCKAHSCAMHGFLLVHAHKKVNWKWKVCSWWPQNYRMWWLYSV